MTIGKWNSFADSRPDELQWVLAWNPKYGKPELICFGAGWYQGVIPHGELTHWMALPTNAVSGPPPERCKTCGHVMTGPEALNYE